MDYYEISFTYESLLPTDIINDILASELGNIGFDSFLPEDDRLLAYINADNFNEQSLNDCLSHFPLQGNRFFHARQLIKDRNWNEEWEKNYYRPIIIADECLIRASFHPEEKGFNYSIVIDPKMAFGTGNHATTYLMLHELLKLDLHDKSFLDMGCGTAVLAILAAKKGASRVVAVDIDEWAYNSANENCRLNHTEQVEVARGDAEQIARFGAFDYIFANINRNVLIKDVHLYVPALKPGGSIFMSGFYREDVPAIEEACHHNGLSLCASTERERWVAVHVR